MQGCRRRWPGVWLSACSAALVLAGCGSGGRQAVEMPKLPAPLAHSLAGLSDQVAARLGGGDACGAAATATDLQQRTIASIRSVPAALQESLQSAVNDLANRTQAACMAATPASPPVSPPPPPPVTAPPEHGKGHGHGKGHKKHGDEGGGD